MADDEVLTIASNCDAVFQAVRPHLYLGNRRNASNLHLLKNHNIRRVLTLDTEPLAISDANSNLNFKFVRCMDEPEADLLSSFDECIEFIKSGVAVNENVLVHW